MGHGGGGKLSAELSSIFYARLSNPVLTNLWRPSYPSIARARLLHRHIYGAPALSSPAATSAERRQRHGERHRHVRATPLFSAQASSSKRDGALAAGAIAQSMGEAAAAAGVSIVAGDTKVVDKGHGDGVTSTLPASACPGRRHSRRSAPVRRRRDRQRHDRRPRHRHHEHAGLEFDTVIRAIPPRSTASSLPCSRSATSMCCATRRVAALLRSTKGAPPASASPRRAQAACDGAGAVRLRAARSRPALCCQRGQTCRHRAARIRQEIRRHARISLGRHIGSVTAETQASSPRAPASAPRASSTCRSASNCRASAKTPLP